jgi:hypothetical protein
LRRTFDTRHLVTQATRETRRHGPFNPSPLPRIQRVERIRQGVTELGQQIEVRPVPRPSGGGGFGDRNGFKPSVDNAARAAVPPSVNLGQVAML